MSDRGRGIDAEDLRTSSSRSTAAATRIERQIHGNGLGLSLVKRIAEAHGGRVTVKSAPGDGTTFTLHLPAPPGRAQQRAGRGPIRPPTRPTTAIAPRPTDAGRTTASKRVLLVEDEPGLVLTLTDRLKSEGYDVQAASDGPSGSTARRASAGT